MRHSGLDPSVLGESHTVNSKVCFRSQLIALVFRFGIAVDDSMLATLHCIMECVKFVLILYEPLRCK